MGRGPSPSLRPPLAERGGCEPSSGCRRSCEEAGTEPHPSAWPPRPGGMLPRAHGPGGRVAPTRGRPCRPFPQGDVTGGARTPARPVRPAAPGSPGSPIVLRGQGATSRRPRRQGQPAGAPAAGRRMHSAPSAVRPLPAAGSTLAQASGGLAPGSPRLPADPHPSWKGRLSRGPGLRGPMSRVTPGRHRAGTPGCSHRDPRGAPVAPDAGGLPFPVPSGRGRAGAAGMS